MTPRSAVLLSMAWLGILVITSQSWWKPIRNYIEQRTHEMPYANTGPSMGSGLSGTAAAAGKGGGGGGGGSW